MVHFTTDMVHYFKDLSICNTQHANWQDCLWVIASGSPAKKIGQLVPQRTSSGNTTSPRNIGGICESQNTRLKGIHRYSDWIAFKCYRLTVKC